MRSSYFLFLCYEILTGFKSDNQIVFIIHVLFDILFKDFLSKFCFISVNEIYVVYVHVQC